MHPIAAGPARRISSSQPHIRHHKHHKHSARITPALLAAPTSQAARAQAAAGQEEAGAAARKAAALGDLTRMRAWFVKLMVERSGLSGGWRGFAIDHVRGC